jgi:hypothetical protein
MRFEIARSLKGGKIIHIARDTSGVVRLREETEEKLIEAIKEYNETLAKAAEEKTKAAKEGEGLSFGKSQDESVKEKVAQEEESLPTLTATNNENTVEEKKEFLKSETKEIIETKRKSSGKKTFWDKLK